MKLNTLSAAILASIIALPAAAAQFAVRIDRPYEGAGTALMETLRITEIESFSEDGAQYVVLEAPDEGYVEAFFFAIGHKAIELNALEADWNLPAMRALTPAQRLQFLRVIECDFCTS